MLINRCPYCMEEIGNSTICPHCHQDIFSAQNPPQSLQLNTILHGKYLVGAVLGQGGYGITYIGYDLLLEIKVAIKEYYPSYMASRSYSGAVLFSTKGISKEEGCNNFLKEARKMAKLMDIPEVVRVIEILQENDTAYIIMEYVKGITLKDKLKRDGLLTEKDAISLLKPVSDALDKVHKQGIIHRDISPDNIMIDQNGAVKLLDLGAAKEVDMRSELDKQSSQMIHKDGFSPPEQYTRGGNIGPWTDVYAMSATVYYCLTGKVIPPAMDRVYSGESVNFPQGLSATVKNAIEKGLSIKLDDRYQSMEELWNAIQGKKQFKTTPVTTSSTSSLSGAVQKKKSGSKKIVAAVALCAVIAGAIVGVTSISGSHNSVTEPEVSDANSESSLETSGTSSEKSASTSEVASEPVQSEETITDNEITYKIVDGKAYIMSYSGSSLHVAIPAEAYSSDGTAYSVEYSSDKYMDESTDKLIFHREITAGELTYKETTGGICITGYIPSTTKNSEYIAIPLEINGEDVVAIEEDAFSNSGKSEEDQYSFKGIILPDTVGVVGVNAFKDCTAMEYVNIPSNLIQICDSAFENCSLKDLKIVLPEKIQSIGGLAYSNTKIKSVYLPDSLEIDGANPFAGCAQGKGDFFEIDAESTSFCVENGILYNANKSTIYAAEAGSTGDLEIPSTVTEIRAYAFKSTGYTLIKIPSTVNVYSNAFAGALISKAELADGITEIPDGAFSDCSNLSEITVPETVKSVASGAFIGCSSLSSVVLSSDCEIDDNAFESTTTINNVTLNFVVKWSDDKNSDGARPAEVKIKILADGSKLKTIKVTSDGDWEK